MATADFKVKHGLSVGGNTTLTGTVSTAGLTLSSTTSPITLNASVGTAGQVLTSAGPGATPTWETGGGGSTLDGLTDVVITTPAEGQILLHDGTGWINSPAIGAREVFTATASQTVFTTTNSYVVGSGQLSVYINGVKQYPSTYTETSTTSFTLSEGAVVGDQVMAEISVLTSNYVQPPAVIALDELTDVVVTTPTTDQILSYNGTSWVNVTNPAAGSPITYNVGNLNIHGPTGLLNNTTGGSNTVYGYNALSSNTTGYGNVAVGLSAASNNTTGNDNVAVGGYALGLNSTGGGNVACGPASQYSLYSGSFNTATGTSSLHGNNSGNNNTAVGHSALNDCGQLTSTGAFVVGVTYTIRDVGDTDFTLIGAASNTPGVVFTATGVGGGTTGTASPNVLNNTAIGHQAGYNIKTGSNNTMIGSYMGTANMSGNVVLSTGDGTVRFSHDGTLWTSATPISMAGLILPSTTSPITLNGSVGTSGQVLTSAGPGATPTWTSVSGPITYSDSNLYGPTAVSGGTYNTTYGYQALLSNTSGSYNTTGGYQALLSNTSGSYNTATGSQALQNNTSGIFNTATGYQASRSMVTGTSNTSYGVRALMLTGAITVAGSFVVGVTYTIQTVGTTDFTAIGAASNTTGVVFTASGVGTGTGTATSNNIGNTAFGYEAGYYNNTGDYNTAIGHRALHDNTTGTHNVSCGVNALADNTTGKYNTACGGSAVQTNRVGEGHTAVGYLALPYTGINTSSAGITAGYTYQIVDVGTTDWVALGAASNTLGVQFVATGAGAGTGYAFAVTNNNTAIGHKALNYNYIYSNATGIGYNAAVSGSNQVQLGDSATTTYVYGTVQNRSDIRDKADVRDTVLGLDFVNALRPVDFKWDYREDYEDRVSDGSKKRSRYHHGLIAQEVKQVLDATDIDFGGYQDHSIAGGEDVLSIGYDELIAPLIKAVQELTIQNQAMTARIAALESR